MRRSRLCFLLPLSLLLLALAPSSALEAVRAGVIPDFVTDNIVDVQVVCPPDSRVCPNGGRAFRDKNHNCKFTPCELVAAPAAAPAPAPAPGVLRTRNTSMWFRNEEFVVPRLAFRDLQRGKRVSERVTRVLRHKSQRSLAWAKSYTFAATVDIVSVPARHPEQPHRKGDDASGPIQDNDKSKAHDRILTEALSTGGDLALAQQGTLLVAACKPLTRFAFFGYLARHPTAENVRKMVTLVQDAHSLATAVKEKPANATSPAAFFADLKPKMIVALPTLVVPSQHNSASPPAIAGATQWLVHQPAPVQARVFQFLVRELQRLGILEEEAQPTLSADAGQAGDTSVLPALVEVTSASVEHETPFSSVSRTGRSRAFAPQYKGVSASVAVFVTPISALVEDSDPSDPNGSNDTGTFARSAWSLWNFTLLRCDALEAVARERQQEGTRVPFTVLRVLSASPSQSQLQSPSQALQEQTLRRRKDLEGSAGSTSWSPAGGVVDRLRCNSSSSSGGGSGVTASVAGAPEVVFSCWIYEQIGDDPVLAGASASAATSVRFEQLRC